MLGELDVEGRIGYGWFCNLVLDQVQEHTELVVKLYASVVYPFLDSCAYHVPSPCTLSSVWRMDPCLNC